MKALYKVTIEQYNGITTTSYFTLDEINERLTWWVIDFKKVTIQ